LQLNTEEIHITKRIYKVSDRVKFVGTNHLRVDN
jgi:hypothetical protein